MKDICAYSGIYTHQGYEQSRRDDLESLIYILIYLSKGEITLDGSESKCEEEKI